ncbi:nucleoside-diphosphate kinase [candidate division WOR-3 bacterium]|uniref:Nucleoside-diphosphate kinase n=1 Tax=candidate division WOR-3 bacterium TaxID=2052148 RepID=A0A9D5QF08_UNCW3|nr:nucleoside-diphosphate kinase [candidate division WOR-3 bacterium]MBD3365535.1 nucleoside-diphosphate kinase [candidate division WOR-3 bacterium]
MERTLLVIKPNVVALNKTGEILARCEKEGFVILGLKHLILSPQEAKLFYKIHEDKGFYRELVNYITSGHIIACCLGRQNAIRYLREIVGDTDPAKAAPGTLRAMYGTDIEHNGVHASNPDEDPEREVHFFFSTHELLS